MGAVLADRAKEASGGMKRNFSPVPAIYVTLLMIPVYWLISMSFKTNGEIFGGMTLYPHAPTLDNYHLILSDPDWYLGYVNAGVYALLNVIISVTAAIPAAYAFSRFSFFGDRVLLFGFLAFRMMAPAILLIPFVEIFSRLNMIDTYWAVALAHCFFNLPLAIWILEGFISSIPKEMDEIARVDGYGFARFFLRILLPQIAPGIAVAAFFCFMFSWIENLLSNALTVIDSKPIGAIMSRAGGVLSADIALLATASVIGMIPGIVLILLMKNHLARGFSMGRIV
jgi:glycerol transport system permease protein